MCYPSNVFRLSGVGVEYAPEVSGLRVHETTSGSRRCGVGAQDARSAQGPRPDAGPSMIDSIPSVPAGGGPLAVDEDGVRAVVAPEPAFGWESDQRRAVFRKYPFLRAPAERRLALHGSTVTTAAPAAPRRCFRSMAIGQPRTAT